MGIELTDWTPRQRPDLDRLEGRFVSLVPFDPDQHLAGLFAAIGGGENDDLYDFMPLGPFSEPSGLAKILADSAAEWRTLVLLKAGNDEVLGMMSFMRIRPQHGSIEIGAVTFGKKMQRTPAGTEAHFLALKYAFEDLGYRRYEWKCHASNAKSMRAARRLGFTFEGIFRKDMVLRGTNRDTAWLSIVDDEWPARKRAFEEWLAPENFDDNGQQIRPLA